MIKPTLWNGADLTGIWEISIKVDGVRALWNGEQWLSRADKPLYNIPDPLPGDAHDIEVYLGSLKDSVRAVRTQHLKPDTPVVTREHMFALDPLDKRLEWGASLNPNKEFITQSAEFVIEAGHEGLVLRQGDKWLKVKPKETVDLLVTGYGEGEGKFAGTLGYFETSIGRVGSFSIPDHERDELWARGDGLLGITIEVDYMHLTPDGVMRHARFIRERFDKVADR